MATVSIKGIDKADLLAALYNGSRPLGLGAVRARLTGTMSGDMTRAEALRIMTVGDDVTQDFGQLRPGRLYFDYVNGRPLKVDITGDTLDTYLYDRDMGAGAGARVVATLQTR